MRTKLTFFLLGCAAMLAAQNVEVKSTRKIERESNAEAFYPVFTPDGSALLLTDGYYKGLSLYDMESGKERVLSNEPGAGFNPMFSADGREIYFHRENVVNGRRMKTLMCYETQEGVAKSISEPVRQTRDLKKRVQQRTLRAEYVEVAGEDLKLVVRRNGERRELSPVGEVPGYIWISLSPDKTKILFTAPTKGTFVCDLEGKVIASLGYLNAPVWYNDTLVVGMQDADNGEVVTSSSVVMASLNGKMRKILTPAQQIAMYPAVSSATGRIAYNTFSGNVYVMEIEIR